jgi:uncharacterized protein
MLGFAFGGHQFEIVDRTALYWPERSALIVADLHLEKASWFAARGQMLPPHDSLATLERLDALIAQTGARALWCLGDNFHDAAGVDRLAGQARNILSRLTVDLDWHWITGNHDAALPDCVGGVVLDEANTHGLVLRHEADPKELRPELSGHFHPKYRANGPRGGVTRPCFVMSGTKLILPSFGALTGGLYADHQAIRAAVGPVADALIASGGRIVRLTI